MKSIKSKVSIIKCESYEKNLVKESINKCVKLLGGFENFIKPTHKKILLKPNLLQAALPEYAITTHPIFIECVVEILKNIGIKPSSIIIADSPGAGIPFTKSNLERVYQKTGVLDVSLKTGCVLNYDTSYTSVSFKEGVNIKKIDLIKVALDADVIINLPKLKTHNLTGITGAVKNLFGLVPGFLKPGYHVRFPEVENFIGMLVDIACFIKPSLNIVDGIIGMEGNGPGMSGTPRKVGLILASSNPFSVDTVIAKIIGLRENFSMFTKVMLDRGISCTEIDNIEIAGEEIENVLISNFIFPQNINIDRLGRLTNNYFFRNYIMPFVRNTLNPYPFLNISKCTFCKTCIGVCPQKALSIKGSKIFLNYKKCIRCFCCSELCPQGAIELKYSYIGRLVLKSLGGLDQERE
ncbi:MAG: DUF362 domain-containing protein [Actinobacteria bacterium]|nr:DUF362 domain-containing protein [Actinomycetota bacterium]